MPRWSQAEYAAHLEFLDRKKDARHREMERDAGGCTNEIEEVHLPIIRFCNSQRPRWKYIHARPDQPSTIEKGAADFIIFAPGRRVLIIECKRAGGKHSTDQLAWAHEMRLLGWDVDVVRSYKQFLELINPAAPITPE